MKKISTKLQKYEIAMLSKIAKSCSTILFIYIFSGIYNKLWILSTTTYLTFKQSNYFCFIPTSFDITQCTISASCHNSIINIIKTSDGLKIDPSQLLVLILKSLKRPKINILHQSFLTKVVRWIGPYSVLNLGPAW